jgi:hypothetical protein
MKQFIIHHKMDLRKGIRKGKELRRKMVQTQDQV